MTILTPGSHPDFLDLPWGEPLIDWDHPRLVSMAHGISRHVVRFVRYSERVYALKETEDRVARSELDMLRVLNEEHLPVVRPVGVVTSSDTSVAILITRYLDYSLPYWYLFGRDEVHGLADHLTNAGVALLVRLHLDGVFWGDCSLSNILFRRDAGALMAYLVDAETTERHKAISDGMRSYDIDIAVENIIGGLLNLQQEGRVSPDLDPFEVGDQFRERYQNLWEELTRSDSFALDERWRINKRIEYINDLGFDVEELSISADGTELRITPIVLEEGHHSRELRRRTGLDVQENQARRLLSDIRSFQAWLGGQDSRPVPEAVGAARWLAEVYEPLMVSVPAQLRERLEEAEIFHNLLEHRYLLAESLGREVPNEEALADYLEKNLQSRPAERQLRE